VAHSGHQDGRSHGLNFSPISVSLARAALFLTGSTQWAVYAMSHVSLLELLEYCGSFSILIAVIFYFMDGPERTKNKALPGMAGDQHRAREGGSGGRNDALHQLTKTMCRSSGVDVSDAFLQKVDLKNADLRRSDFHGADLKAPRWWARVWNRLNSAHRTCRSQSLESEPDQCTAADADLTDADFSGALLHGSPRSRRSARRESRRHTRVDAMTSVKLANIHGVRNAPDGFVAWR